MKRLGIVASLVVAFAATALMLDGVADLGIGPWWLYPGDVFVAFAAAWAAPFAWATERRLLAIPAHLVTLLAPWGFLYFAPLLAIMLALAAGVTFRTSPSVGEAPPERTSRLPVFSKVLSLSGQAMVLIITAATLLILGLASARYLWFGALGRDECRSDVIQDICILNTVPIWFSVLTTVALGVLLVAIYRAVLRLSASGPSATKRSLSTSA